MLHQGKIPVRELARLQPSSYSTWQTECEKCKGRAWCTHLILRCHLASETQRSSRHFVNRCKLLQYSLSTTEQIVGGIANHRMALVIGCQYIISIRQKHGIFCLMFVQVLHVQPAWQVSEGQGKRKDERVKREKNGRGRIASFSLLGSFDFPPFLRPATQAIACHKVKLIIKQLTFCERRVNLHDTSMGQRKT